MQNGIIKFEAAGGQKGFTLIETIVSIFVFSVLATAVTGIFAKAVQVQAGSFSAQRTVENSLLALESIARDIRVSQICPAGSSCSATRLDIVHPVRGSVSYFLDTGRHVIQKTEGGNTVDITSTDTNFTRFDFLTTGLAIDDRQPKVTIVITVQNNVGRPVVFDLQTTITSRDVTQEFQN
ncbi:MAG: prepilin-type N-terminal cleavage/methylation domain-containing protein [Candidatus Yanofskybacteria bacterium]|nr:prepilin-type N-terminal cleavage/methylation domain-containing protein [Candidatus Yanofskybacteria bacterium]